MERVLASPSPVERIDREHEAAAEDGPHARAAELLRTLVDVLCDAPTVRSDDRHDRALFLVRILYCCFADATGALPDEAFQRYLQRSEGHDLEDRLARFFAALGTPAAERIHVGEELRDLPHVGGDLFPGEVPIPYGASALRERLLECARLGWARLSPAVLGDVLQTACQPDERRRGGAHYTGERDILKLVRSLFLDELRAELVAAGGARERLLALHARLAAIRVLDPACGCGNFLVVTYRELRELELELLRALGPDGAAPRLSLDLLAGIEIDPLSAGVAELALDLLDRQLDLRLRAAGLAPRPRGQVRLHRGNALRLDWRAVLPPDDATLVLGNPPFLGKHVQSPEQRGELATLLRGARGAGDLDYVCGWFLQAADYLAGTRAVAAFVATSSITQGEQAAALWPLLFERGVELHFAHRSFAWRRDARGGPHVHVVILGLACWEAPVKRIVDHERDSQRPAVSVVRDISPYLVEGPRRVVRKAVQPLSPAPAMRCGNKPADGGAFVLSASERDDLLAREPAAARFLRPFVGSEELLHGRPRWCLWLVDVKSEELAAMPLVARRVEAVRQFRARSSAAPTRKAAATPERFFFIAQPDTSYLAVPEVSSERRRCIPLAFLPAEVIASNKLYLVPGRDLFLFGLLSSAMHMTWVRTVSGRLEARFQYSATLVYNTFPWPDPPDPALRAAVEAAAQQVLDARARRPDLTLAGLYDPREHDPALAEAHAALDRAVDRCYREAPFPGDRARLELLMARYERLLAAPRPLLLAARPGRP